MLNSIAINRIDPQRIPRNKSWRNSLGCGFLAFNRRGHDSVSTYNSRDPVGGAYQTVAEGIEDNERAAQFLADHGFKEPIVIGHSNGGFWRASMPAVIRRLALWFCFPRMPAATG